MFFVIMLWECRVSVYVNGRISLFTIVLLLATPPTASSFKCGLSYYFVTVFIDFMTMCDWVDDWVVSKLYRVLQKAWSGSTFLKCIDIFEQKIFLRFQLFLDASRIFFKINKIIFALFHKIFLWELITDVFYIDTTEKKHYFCNIANFLVNFLTLNNKYP